MIYVLSIHSVWFNTGCPPKNVHQVLRASHLFSLGWCWSLCFFLPLPQLGWFSVCAHEPSVTACIQNLLGHAQGASHRRVGDGFGSTCRSVGGSWRWGVLSGLWGVFLMEFVRHLGSVAIWWVVSPDCYSPGFCQLLSCANHLSIWSGWESSRSLGQCPTWLGKSGTYYTLISLLDNARGYFLALSCATLWEGWCS